MQSSPTLGPAALWAEITKTPRPNREIDFPRINPSTNQPFCKLTLFVLTPSEQINCVVNAEKKVKKLYGDVKSEDRSDGFRGAFDQAVNAELLFESARYSADLSQRFFPSVEEMTRVLTVDELAVLIEAYMHMCTEIGPIVSEMTDEVKEAWIERLQGGAWSVSPLYLLSPAKKNELTVYLAHQLHSLRTASSSA